MKNLLDHRGELVFKLQIEKMKEIGIKLTNPFWRDVLYDLALAKLVIKTCVNNTLSLDIINFVPCEDFPYYIRWKNCGTQYLYD